MNITLRTTAPAFANEMLDVVKLFFDDAVLSDSGGMVVLHTDEIADGERVSTVRVSGAFIAESVRRQSPQADALLDKRLHKRQVKLALYDCMKEITGISPPWGSLTGVRPARLVYARMQAGESLTEAVAGVRETFDISKEKSDLLKEIVSVQASLSAPKSSDVDLYIGIPFCVSRCAYCSFISAEVGKGALLAPYVDALTGEIAGVIDLIRQNGLRPRALYVGGGTPTALPASLLARVLSAAKPLILSAQEITIEAGRPDTIDHDKLQVIRDSGATRLSINPQTMHDETLRRIGRAHTRRQTEEAYALARTMGFSHINMDLITGLPGETVEDFNKTLLWSEQLSPESLTVHTLSIKRSSLLHLWEASLPDGDMVAQMVRLGVQSATSRGMRPYYLYRQKHMAGNQENVGYALPGHECLYNIEMMEETAHILAMGAGGISKRVAPAEGKIVRAPNISNIGEYISRADEMLARKQALWAEKE